jgi:hypothetical protein
MSDIELAIKRCKRLESLLTKHFAAEGRGLHEKISSVESELPFPLIKRLRFIATVRNRLVHEEDVDKLENRDDYLRACNAAEAELSKLAGIPTGLSWLRTLQVIIGILLLLAIVLFAWLWR